MPDRHRTLSLWTFGAALAGVFALSQSGLAADPLPPVVMKSLPATASAQVRMPVARSGPIRSVLNVPDRMRYGDYRWHDADVPRGRIWVRIDREAQILSVFRGGHEIGTAVVLYGALEKPTPAGRYPILAKYRHHRSSLYDADMPYTLRLTHDGISVHASNVREGAATHGCIGLPPEFARKLFEHARIGDAVQII